MGVGSKKGIECLPVWAIISNFGDESNVRGMFFAKALGFSLGEGDRVRF